MTTALTSDQSTGREAIRPAAAAAALPLPGAGTQSNVALSHLLKVESDARRAASVSELSHLIVNETRSLLRARQVFLLQHQRASRALRFEVRAVSSLSVVDRQSPLVRFIEGLTARLANTDGVAQLRDFTLPAYCDTADTSAQSYPFPNLLWVPLWLPSQIPENKGSDKDRTDGLLIARETPWLEADRRIALRLSETFGHALALRRFSKPSVLPSLARRRLALLALPMLALTLAIPVPITALAPVEVVPRKPHIVAMPVDGLVQTVLVSPNEAVKAGQTLVRLSDTVARNKLALAEREVAVAEARVERASSLGFSDPKGRHDLGIARAELALRMAERNYARDLHEKLTIAAALDGIAVFSDRKDLEGKPFATGDRLLQIVQLGEIELEINLPVSDSIVLRPGAKARAFLDSDPLVAFSGEALRIDYQARVSDAKVAAYRIVASIDHSGREAPRLGTRGTAQLEGPSGPLGLLLFRRPLSALRQWLGL